MFYDIFRQLQIYAARHPNQINALTEEEFQSMLQVPSDACDTCPPLSVSEFTENPGELSEISPRP